MEVDSSKPNIILPCLIAAVTVGALALYQEPQLRQFLWNQIKFFIPVNWSWDAFIPQSLSFTSKKVEAIAIKQRVVGVNNCLVGGKESLRLTNGQTLQVRHVAKNGDCFFLCYGVNLLTVLHQAGTIDLIVPLLEEKGLSDEKKKVFKTLALEAANTWEEKKLEQMFCNDKKMKELVSAFRELTALAIQERPLVDLEQSDKTMPDQITILGAMPREDFIKSSQDLPRDQIQKLLASVRENLWANDALISLLCEKMNFGVRIFQKEVFPAYRNGVEIGNPDGFMMVVNNHYSVIYPSNLSGSEVRFPLAGKYERMLVGEDRAEVRRVKEEERHHSFFLSYTVNLLTSFYEKQDYSSFHDLVLKQMKVGDFLKEKVLEIALEACFAETEKDLESIFSDDRKMGVFIAFLRELIISSSEEKGLDRPEDLGTSGVPEENHIEALCDKIGMGLRIFEKKLNGAVVQKGIGNPSFDLFRQEREYASIRFLLPKDVEQIEKMESIDFSLSSKKVIPVGESFAEVRTVKESLKSDSFFLSYAVNLLMHLYEKAAYDGFFEAFLQDVELDEELKSKVMDIAFLANCEELESDLERDILLDNQKMNVLLDFLRAFMNLISKEKGLLQLGPFEAPTKKHIQALCEKTGFGFLLKEESSGEEVIEEEIGNPQGQLLLKNGVYMPIRFLKDLFNDCSDEIELIIEESEEKFPNEKTHSFFVEKGRRAPPPTPDLEENDASNWFFKEKEG